MTSNITVKDFDSGLSRTVKTTETATVHVGHHNIDVILAGETHIGSVTGINALISQTFTRPADITAYASGDLVANNTSAGSVVALSFAACARVSGGTGRIKRLKLKKSSTALTNASFRLHIYTADPALSSGISNGDNAAWLTKEGSWIGFIDITIDKAFVDAAIGVAKPTEDIAFDATAAILYGLIEARAGYTPTSAEIFTAYLDIEQD